MTIKKVVRTRWCDDERGFVYVCEPIEETISVVEKPDGGYEVRYLTQDTDPIPPNDCGNDCLFLVHYHRSFQVERELCPKNVLGYLYTDNEAYDKDGAEELLKTHQWFPVDSYIHSGVSLRLAGGFAGRLSQGHEQFDVSHAGAVLVSKKEWPDKEKAEEVAGCKVKEWNQYLSGDVYCVVVEQYDKDKQQTSYDICGGFYGRDYAEEEMKNVAEVDVEAK